MITVLVLTSWLMAQDNRPVVHWVRMDLPPLHFLRGPLKNQGVMDLPAIQLQKKLTQYRHQDLLAHMVRVYTYSKKATVCSCGALKTKERLQKYYFTKGPIANHFARSAVIRREDQKKVTPFITNGRLNLVRLAKESDMRIGAEGGRARSLVWEQAINIFKERGLIFTRMAQFQMTEGIIKMLIKKREIDLFGLPPLEYNYLVTKNPTYGEKTMAFLVHKSELLPNFLMCNKTEHGKKIIDLVNAQYLPMIRRIHHKLTLQWSKGPAKAAHERYFKEGERLGWKKMPAESILQIGGDS